MRGYEGKTTQPVSITAEGSDVDREVGKHRVPSPSVRRADWTCIITPRARA